MTNANDTINAIVETSTSPFGGERMECTNGGLTKREYFAAMAMQGLLVNRYSQDLSDGTRVANMSISIADALIEQLNKNK